MLPSMLCVHAWPSAEAAAAALLLPLAGTVKIDVSAVLKGEPLFRGTLMQTKTLTGESLAGNEREESGDGGETHSEYCVCE